MPTPPAAAEAATTSPSLTATASVAANAVAPATYSDPAASQLSAAGLGTTCVSGTRTYSAWPARSHVQPSNSAPVPTTTPAKSLP